MKDMTDLMLHFMQDIYYAEKLGVRSMAKMAKAVESPELKAAILSHREESQRQVERLGQVFEALGKRPKGKTCAAMDGLVEESEEAVDEFDRGPVLDAALIAHVQAVKHYEIARYGAMAAWAKQLGLDEAVGLLQETLDEDRAADATMSDLAKRITNPAAAKTEGDEEDDDSEDESEGIDKGDEPEAKPAKKKSK